MTRWLQWIGTGVAVGLATVILRIAFAEILASITPA